MSKVKKKLINNKKEFKKTGGGPNRTQILSELEEDVIRITGTEEAVFGIEETRSYGLQIEDTPTHQIEIPPLQSVSEENIVEENVIHEESDRRAKKSRPNEENLETLLKTQKENQKSMTETLKENLPKIVKEANETAYYSRKISKALDEIKTKYKKDVEDKFRHSRVLEQQRAEEIEIKKKRLDLEI